MAIISTAIFSAANGAADTDTTLNPAAATATAAFVSSEITTTTEAAAVGQTNTRQLFIKLTPATGDGVQFQFQVKVGTCQHCVLETVASGGKPERAWLPDPSNPDAALDFNRDALVAGLAALGVSVKTAQEYICP